VFIDHRDGVKYGLNETDIYKAYQREYLHHLTMPQEFRYRSTLQMQEYEKARANLQAMKTQYGLKIETPDCVRPVEGNIFHFPVPLAWFP